MSTHQEFRPGRHPDVEAGRRWESGEAAGGEAVGGAAGLDGLLARNRTTSWRPDWGVGWWPYRGPAWPRERARPR